MPTVIIPPTDVSPNTGSGSEVLATDPVFPNNITVNGTTDSSSKDTGAIVTEGGLGVEKSATIGGNLTVSGTGPHTFSGRLNITNTSGNVSLVQGAGAAGSNYGLRVQAGLNASDYGLFVTDSTSTSGYFIVRGDGSAKAFNGFEVGGNLTVSGNSTLGSGNTYPIYGYSGYFQFAGLTAGKFAAAGTYRAHAGVGSDTFSIQLYNGSAWSEVANFGSTSTNIGGNLTVSGTGTSTFGGTIRAGAGSGETLGAGSVDVAADLGIKSTQGIVQGGARIVAFTNGNTLLGTGTDSGNGKLQLATHTTSAGGIGFGTDTSLYRIGTGWLALDSTGGDNPNLWFRESGSSKATVQSYLGDLYISTVTSGKSMYLRTGVNTTALTLDSSQRVITASTLNVGSGTNDAQFINVFTNKVQNTSGPVTINLPADSSGVVTLYSAQGGIGKSMWQIPYINDGGTVQLGTAVKTIKTADPVSSAVAATGAITVSVLAANTYCYWGINCVKP